MSIHDVLSVLSFTYDTFAFFSKGLGGNEMFKFHGETFKLVI